MSFFTPLLCWWLFCFQFFSQKRIENKSVRIEIFAPFFFIFFIKNLVISWTCRTFMVRKEVAKDPPSEIDGVGIIRPYHKFKMLTICYLTKNICVYHSFYIWIYDEKKYLKKNSKMLAVSNFCSIFVSFN